MPKKALLSTLIVCWLLVAIPALVPPHGVQSSSDPLSRAWNNLRAASQAEQTVQRAWLLAQVSGAYKFHTELDQTTYYAPALTNAGRPARVDSLYLEGQTDVKNQSLQLAIWQGGSVLRPADAVEIRVEGGKAYSRAAGGAWQEMDDFSGVFAPAQDPLGYLHGARDIQPAPPDADAPPGGIRQFSFALDGPAFAEYMRGQMEGELRRAGKLPANLTLDSSRVYRDMIGSGRLWLTSDGLPLRIELQLAFPQQSDGSRVKATVRSDFSNFAGLQADAYRKTPLMGAMLDRDTPAPLANLAARLWLIDWPALAGQLGLVLLTGLLMLILLMLRRRAWVYAAISLAVIASMVLTPLLESSRAYAFGQEQAAARAKYEAERAAQQAQRDLEEQLRSAWNPTQDPLAAAEARATRSEAQAAPAAPTQSSASLTRTSLDNPTAPRLAAANPGEDSDNDGVPDTDEPPGCVGKTDCDGDGLTDLQEYRLSTRLDNKDSDGDSLRDDMEVKGFGATSKTLAGKWYSDPNSIDTNLDGLPDSLECWTDNTFAAIKDALPSNQPCDKDTDGDGTPDNFDQDNDNDGIDDIRDLSPSNVSSTPYNNATPFLLQVSGLTPNEPLFVDVQLAPTTPNQVSYARNVLDWPSGDTLGQVQRTRDNTFATGRPAGSFAASDEYGDMRLVPLVEVKIPAADAGNLLPATRNLSTTRSILGYYMVKTGSGAAAKTEPVVWLRGQIEFRAENGSTTLAFTSLKDKDGAALTVDRVKLFAAPNCPVSPSATAQYTRTTPTSAGDVWTLTGVALPSLLDGGHVIMLEKGSGDAMKTACLPLGDVPNGLLGNGWMFDSAKLDAYGVNLRDVVDAGGATTHVMAYAPANVVVGRTGGEKQAFAARLPYWPGAGVTSLGAAQEVRLVWMVQLLDDDGDVQIIHTYPNESWKLAGLSARQDFAVRSAVFYQNPDDNDNTDPSTKAIHTRMWALAQVLGAHLAIDRINKPRLELNGNLLGALESQYQFPAGSLGMAFNAYETQDDIARVPSEVTPAILDKFLSGGAYKAGYDHALLLFAREEDYKAATWRGESAVTLPAATDTLASYNWKAFRYAGGEWETWPLAAYLDLVRVRLPDILLAANLPIILNAGVERENIVNGMALAGQSYALGMFYGGNQMVRVAGQPVEQPAGEEDDTVSTIGDDVVGQVLNFVVDELLEDYIDQFTSVQSGQPKPTALSALGEVLKGKFTEGLDARTTFAKVKAGAAIGLTAVSYAAAATALGLTIAGLAGADTATAANIVEIVSKTLDVITNVVQLVDSVNKARQAISQAGSLLKAVQSSANAIGKAATIAAVVGLVLTIGIAVGVFITQWAMGAFNISDLGFTQALAALAATVIVAVIMFVIAMIPIVGQIIMAVIAIIDAAIGAICAVSKAAGYDMEEKWKTKMPGGSGAELSFCAGLSGLMTTIIQWSIFSQNVLVANMEDAERMKTSNFMLGLVNPAAGFQVGNAIKPSLRVDNKIELIDQPADWKSAFYFWQINWDILDNATHRYDLTPDKADKSVGLSEMEGEWQELGADGKLTGGHRSPGIQYDDPLHMAPATAQLAPGASVTFTQAGINVSIPLYLREAYANPAQECFWIPPVVPPFLWLPPVCYIRSDSGVNHIDLGLQFDILPATLNEFYTPAAKGKGYSLAWGQAGDVTFPVMQDFDGDGLRYSADPDDRYWDADGDGLSDLFELQNGTNPALADADSDGLTDRQELLRASSPWQPDSDGDGLLDCQEVFHQVLATDQPGGVCGQVVAPPSEQWRGGWQFVYDLTAGTPQSTWVASDPNALDGDGDTLTDYQEWLYGLHPGVKSDPAILELESLVREANAPAMLLRLEERAGARLFGDTSGLANNATCTGASCPSAGHEGRYTNGLVFSVDDRLVVSAPPGLANQSFTVAFWSKRANVAATDQFIFSSGTGQNNKGLHIGFRQNQFICAFWSNDLTTPAAYADTDWHHWACTYNTLNRQRTIYRDGVQVAQDTASANYQGSGDWHIGARFDNWGYFGGLLDEVAVFPVALDAAQVQAARDARYNPGGAQVAVRPGDALTYDATLTNNLLGKQLTGLLWAEAPAGWTRNVAPQTYQLGPAQAQTLQGQVTVASTAASGAYSLTLTAGAAASDPAVAPPPPLSPPPNFSPPAGFWGQWAFDGNYADSSGQNRNGAPGWANIQPSFVTGFKNQSVDLNNNSDAKNYVTLPADVAYTTDFTFAAWVYWRGGGDWQRIFDFGVDQNNYMFLTPRGDSGEYKFQMRNDGGGEQMVSTPNNYNFPKNTWVHVAFTLSGDTGRLYINGVSVANGTVTYNPNQVYGVNTWLGRSQYPGPYFNGQLDEVYIYHQALSADKIQQLALAGVTDIDDRDTADAMVYLPFDNHYLDYNSYNDGRNPQGNAVPASKTWAQPFVLGRENAALNLDGNGSYVTLPGNVADTADFTFAAWVYWRGGNAWQRIFDFGSGQGDYMFLTPQGDQGEYKFQMRNDGGGEQMVSTSNFSFPKNTWVHVAVTLQGNTGRLYVDGVERASNASMTLYPNQVYGANTWLGRSQYSHDPYFNGLLDEVRIYHRALSKAEIDSLIQKGNLQENVFFTFNDANPRLYRLGNGSVRAAQPLAGSAQKSGGMDGRQALSFDGKTALGLANSSFNMRDSAFTYSIWVKPDVNASGRRTILGQPPTAARDWTDASAGIYLRLNAGQFLNFGWGGDAPWSTGYLMDNPLTRGAWNHVAVTGDRVTARVYVNGKLAGAKSYTQPPPANAQLWLGAGNLCAQVTLSKFWTKWQDDADSSSEFQFSLYDSQGPIAGYWQSGIRNESWSSLQPKAGETVATLCGAGGYIHMEETDASSGDDHFGPNAPLDFHMAPIEHMQQVISPGNGDVTIYYDIASPAQPFWGALDDLSIYHHAMTEEEVQLLYAAGSLPYHFTLDDPPGAGLNANQFNFKNQGAIANAQAQGACSPGACPTSGLPGRINQAVQFQAHQSIQITNLDLPAAAPGFSIWVNPLADGQIFRITKDAFAVTVSRFGNAFCLNAGSCTSVTFPSGQWYHLMVTFDNAAHLYINGQLGPSVGVSWGGAARYSVTLGGGFSGLLDDLRIPYDGSAQAVSRMMGAAPLVLLHLDERGAAVTSFANLGGASATCTGDACPAAGLKGKIGQAARFDGRDRLSIPHSAALNLNQFTLMAWVKPTAGQNVPDMMQMLVVKATNTSQNYTLYLQNDRKINSSLFCSGQYYQELVSNKALPLDQYTHVAVTYNGNRWALYINGALDAVKTVSVNPCPNDAPLIIGANFSGDLDEIQLYNYALYAYQVQDLYAIQANWIEETNGYTVLVDADAPTSALLNAANTYLANADIQLGVKAQDPTSAVALLELGLSRNGGPITWTAAQACQDASGGTATGSPAWCPWFKPTTLGGEGRYVAQTRATDAVGNRETPAAGRALLVDATAPNLTVAQADGSLQALQVHPTQANAQVLNLNGTVSDPNLNSGDAGSGVAQVWVTLRDAGGALVGDAPYPAMLAGKNWTLAYPFLQAQVAGPYYLAVTASDKVGNQTALPARTLYLDGTAPGVELDETASGLPLTRTAASFATVATTLRGVASERPWPTGAAAAYHFEEGAGATSFANAAASSGWPNPGNATCSGAACPTAGGAGRAGNGLSFDGANDALVSSPSAALANSSFSVAMWAKRANTSTTDQWVFASGAGQANHGLHIGFRNNQFMCAFWLNDLMTPAQYADTNWHHWACTYNAVTRQRAIYRDGVQVAQDTASANYQGSGNWYIGARFDNAGYFGGALDEVAIYARALSADEIRVLAAPSLSGLQAAAVSFMPLWADESGGAASPHLSPALAGQTLYLPLDDARGQKGNITFRNLAQLAAPANCWGNACPEPGQRSPGGPAVSFDGKDDYISLQSGQLLNDNFTFAAWVYWRGNASYNPYILATASSGNSARLNIAASGQVSFLSQSTGGTQSVPGPVLPPNTWVHLAFSLQDTVAAFYLNGAAVSSGSITNRMSQASGQGDYLGYGFNGQMSDVRMFSRGLSAAQVQSLWRGTRALLALPLDEVFVRGGSTLPDASGWNQAVTLNTGAGDAANKAAPGVSGPYALNLDGVNDLARTPEKAPLANQSFSVALWARRANVLNDDQFVFSSGTQQDNQGLFLGFRNNRFICSFWNNALMTTATYADTDWHHWACTYDAGTRQRAIYRDGVRVAQDTSPVHYQGSGDWYIGVRLGYDGYFSGALDDVRVYPRSLAAAELADLANTGWRAVALGGEQANWSLPIPAGLEGAYRLDLRGVDVANRASFDSQKAAPSQAIDSLAPRATLIRQTGGNWGSLYHYAFTAQDLYLSKTGLSTPCGYNGSAIEIRRVDPANGTQVLSKLLVECMLAQPAANETAKVCDVAGNCVTVGVTQAALGDQAYVNLLVAPHQSASLPPALQAASINGVPDAQLARPANTAGGVTPVRWNGGLWQNDTAPRPTAPELTLAAPLAGETCFATLDDGATVYSSTTASAVRAALAVASAGDTVKLAGYCAGAVAEFGSTQVAYIAQPLTLAGGYTTTDWTTAYPLTQPTTLDALGGGRVIYASAAVTLTNLTLQNGAADNHGGGAYLAYVPATITGVTFISNTAVGYGGGAAFFDAVTISNTTFTNNNSGAFGGGMYVRLAANVAGATFNGNTSSSDGGGAYFSDAATVADTAFTGNTSGQYGGGASLRGATTVSNTLFIGNSANTGGGAHFDNAFANRLVNSLFARNRADLNGAAVFVADAAPLDLVHTTIVSPTQAPVSAVYLEGGAVYLTNTIVASHTIGINNPLGATVTAWNPLFFGNTNDTAGTVTVHDAVLDDPAWVNPAADDYHLAAASAAINAGLAPVPDVTTDLDGDPRPQQGGYDIGCDETPFNTPPVITPSAGAGGSISPATPQRVAYGSSITFTITPDGGYIILDVRVDGSSVGPISSYAFVNVTVNHTISATFTSAALPETQIDSYPPDPSNSADASFTFSSPDPTATFECQLDGGGFSACVSPQDYAGLSDGPHTFEVRAVNMAGADPTPAAYNWTIDTHPIPPGIFEFIDLPGVVTALPATIPIKGRVAPPNSLTNLMVAIDQTPILTETFPPGTVLSKLFNAGWSPTQSGVYLLTGQATDALSGTVTISATLFVDTEPPQTTLDGSGVYTGAHYAPHTGLVLRGVASDTTGLVSATVHLDLGSGPMPLNVAFDEAAAPAGYLNGQAVYTRTAWSAAWWALDNLPDNVTGALYLALYDVTQAPVTYTFPVTLDLAPPDFGHVVILANGAPITTGLTYTNSPLLTTAHISPTTDGAPVSLWYGWTASYTATLAELTPAADPTVAFTHTRSFTRTVADGGAARFFHIYATDALGNASTARLGPYYHDLPGMPDYISAPGAEDGFTAGVYRAWQANGCTLLGTDRRIPDQNLSQAALSGDQSFYLTWNDDRLHFVWQGADWATDGDLFIYLDTIPDQANPYRQVGGGVAYNPYTSTYSGTVLLLPTQEWSNNPNFVPPAGAPAVNGMHADYALWVKDGADAHVLGWDNAGQQWVDEGNLNELGGVYALNKQVDGAFTDLIVPLDLVGNPQNWVAPFPGLGPEGMGVVALAVDAEEGPSGGLRIWSILPYANPADSARVVPNAPGADQPHLLMLTHRYIAPVAAGACFAPEAGLEFYLSAAVDRFAYDGFADDVRLILPAPAVNPDAWDGLFDPYDDVFRAWLTMDYCPAHPTFPACRAGKPPAELSIAELLAGLINSQHPPLLPGSPVTYTLYYVNPTGTVITPTAYLYSNDDLNNPQSGVAFAGQSWVGGCPGWLALALQPGAGWLVFTGLVQAAGVSTVTLDIAPSYNVGAGCAIVPGDGSWPAYRLTVQHTPDDGAPAFVAIRPDLTTAGPVSASIPGVVVDAAPVGQIEIQVNGAFTFACTDDTPTDGQWQCPWDIPASHGGSVPGNGDEFTLRARATDVFGHTSAWSEPQPVLMDTQAPQFEGGAARRLRLAAQTAATPTLLSDLSIYLSGGIRDNTVPQTVELCNVAGENCAIASLRLDPWTIPPTAYRYADVLTTPLAINGNALCGAGTLGLARTFNITDSFTIGGLQVGLRLAHPYRSDLSARLRSPAGTQVTLFSFNKNVLAENVNALFTNHALARLADDLSSHDLDAGLALRNYRPQNSLSAFNGQDAAGTWTLTLCDSDPANDTGAFYAATLDFAAVAPPLNVTGNWSYRFDASGSDGQVYAWRLYATDIHGNRTAQPYSLTVQVDNVAPVITATQTVTRLLISNSAPVLSGAASDGDVVSAIWVLVTDPLGNVWRDSVQGAADAWTYILTPTLGGRYGLTVYAADRAGNQAGVGAFSLMVVQALDARQTVTPEYDVQAGELVTYTLWVYNYNTEAAENVVVTSTLDRWLTPVDTAGATYLEALPDNYLVWPARSLAAGDAFSLTVTARMPDELIITIPTRVTETLTFTDTPPITVTYIVTEWVDLRGAFFTSRASLNTANLGTSAAYPTIFRAAGAPEAPPAPLVQISKQVTPMLDVPRGSVVTYTLHITNSTNITAENVVVSDTLNLALEPEAIGSATYDPVSRTLTWSARTLAPGESMTYVFSARLTGDQALVDSLSGYVDNQAALDSSLGGAASNVAALYAQVMQRIHLPLVMRAWSLASQRVYLPLVMRAWWLPSQPLTEQIPAIPRQPLTTPGITYYTATLSLTAPMPEGGYFYFSSAPTSVRPVSVDDQLVLVHQGVEIYSQMGIPPVIMPVPRAVVERIAAGGVILEYRDVYGSSIGAEAVWLVWSAARP